MAAGEMYALMPAPVVDDLEHALRLKRAPVGVGEADARILDPEGGLAAAPLGQEAIMETVAQRSAGLGVRSARDPVIAQPGMLGIDQQGEGAALAELGDIGDAEHACGVLGPLDRVGCEIPPIGSRANAL